jgi:hypothetical protein
MLPQTKTLLFIAKVLGCSLMDPAFVPGRFFYGFNFVLVSEFAENKINMLRSNGIMPLSEQKIRAIVTNAKQIQKVQKSVSLQLFAFASGLFAEFITLCYYS